jgi:hypothetical protein
LEENREVKKNLRIAVSIGTEKIDGSGELLLFQFLEPPSEELPLWFLLGQGQRLLIRRPSLGCPAEPAVSICPGGCATYHPCLLVGA